MHPGMRPAVQTNRIVIHMPSFSKDEDMLSPWSFPVNEPEMAGSHSEIVCVCGGVGGGIVCSSLLQAFKSDTGRESSVSIVWPQLPRCRDNTKYMCGWWKQGWGGNRALPGGSSSEEATAERTGSRGAMGRVRNSLVVGPVLRTSRPVCAHRCPPNHPHIFHFLLLLLNWPRLRSVKVGNRICLSHLASSLPPTSAWHQ